jgi:hypothetical protein
MSVEGSSRQRAVRAQPLVVDGGRPAIEWIAALPRDWTTLAERYVLHVIACDSYDGRTSRPGLENLAAWTGMHCSSVAEVVNRLLRPSNHRPALLARTSSAGRNRSEYRLLQPSGQHDRPTVVQQSHDRPASATVNCRPTVVQQSLSPDPPSPLPETPSLSPAQRAVANALGLPLDDEELNSVDQMLKDNSAQTPIPWIRGCAKNGDLGRLLDAAHGATWATQQKAAEADRRRCPHGVINGLLAGQCVACSEDARAVS